MPCTATLSNGLAERFAAALPAVPGLELCDMYGYPAAALNGRICAGVFGETAYVRLPPHLRRAVADAEGAAPFEPNPGRPMLAYVTLPARLVADGPFFAELLAAACAFTAGLPPRRRRPRPVTSGSPRS